ncbi:MAG: maleylacetoacetate isomerase [Sphingobium sp.]|nr:maleylacetoacetate isomerase [Sphingobium sp.]
MTGLTLHGYWRSSAAYRVRIALALKGLDYGQVTHDLRTGAQRASDYLALAPHGLVPAVEWRDAVLIQSPAILEWIEARWPTPALLPEDAEQAATVRAMAAIIGCDIHPLNNLRVLDALRHDLGASTDQVKGWAGRWIGQGFAALEILAARYGKGFLFGDRPTLADCYLVPQIYSAERFGVDLTDFPRLSAAGAALRDLPAVAAAHPARQPDADA